MSAIDLSHAVHYHSGKFPPTELNLEKLYPSLLAATDALARYDQMLTTMHNREIFIAPLRNQEAVLSSKMEGTISTLDEILEYDAEYGEEDDSPRGETRSDVVETILYRRTMVAAQKAIAEGRPISSSLVKSMHQQLLSYGRGITKSPGQFKTEQNYIGESGSRIVSYIPISPEKLQDGLDAFFHYMEGSGHSALIKTAISHVEFEALHPFKDGNGRIGRILITLMLWKAGSISSPHFYISRYMEERKGEYIARMRSVSENGEWDEWCIFFFEAVAAQAKENLKITQTIRDLYEELKQTFIDILASKYALSALDSIFTTPIFQIPKLSRQSKIPQVTLGNFAKRLLDANLLETRQDASGRRPALYAFEPLLKLVRT